MRLLLDTHVLLWFRMGDPRLGPPVRAMIEAPKNTILVSIASIWEIAFKVRIGNLVVDLDRLLDEIQRSDFNRLGVTENHLRTLRHLPLVPGHRDPFDHLPIAQALTEDLTFLSNDAWVGDPVRHQAIA